MDWDLIFLYNIYLEILRRRLIAHKDITITPTNKHALYMIPLFQEKKRNVCGYVQGLYYIDVFGNKRGEVIWNKLT